MTTLCGPLYISGVELLKADTKPLGVFHEHVQSSC